MNTRRATARSPLWSSAITSFTPRRPRSASERRKSVQNVSASLGPVATPRTSRLPSSLTATATILLVGATAVIRSARKAHALHGWLARLLERKKPKVAAVALANKIARIAWAVLSRNTTYQANPA